VSTWERITLTVGECRAVRRIERPPRPALWHFARKGKQILFSLQQCRTRAPRDAESCRPLVMTRGLDAMRTRCNGDGAAKTRIRRWQRARTSPAHHVHLATINVMSSACS